MDYWRFFNFNYNWIMPNYGFNFFNNNFIPFFNTQPTISKPVSVVQFKKQSKKSEKSEKQFTVQLKKQPEAPQKTHQKTQQKAQSAVQHTGHVTTKAASNNSFLSGVKKVASHINCDYRDLLAVMNAESGLKANAKNGTMAVGLIQFTNSSIQELNKVYGLNLTKEKILNMSATEQLEYVEKYIEMAKKRRFSSNEKLDAGDLYSLIFLPGRANRNILTQKGESFYNFNKGLDTNKDGLITKAELAQRVRRFSVNESVFA